MYDPVTAQLEPSLNAVWPYPRCWRPPGPVGLRTPATLTEGHAAVFVVETGEGPTPPETRVCEFYCCPSSWSNFLLPALQEVRSRAMREIPSDRGRSLSAMPRIHRSKGEPRIFIKLKYPVDCRRLVSGLGC